jgi:hypothetical protein
MRRLTIFGLTLVLVVVGVTAAVQAEPPAPPREPSVTEPRMPDRLSRAAFTIRAIARPDCNPAEAARWIKCIDRYLNRLANGVNDALDTFDTFFKCTSYVQISQYGDPAGTFGYEFVNQGQTTPILITALDFWDEVAERPFFNYYVVRPTERCIAFAQ